MGRVGALCCLMCVVWSWLIVGVCCWLLCGPWCCSSSVVRCLLRDVCCWLRNVVCSAVFALRCVLFVVYCMPCFAAYVLLVVWSRCLLFVVRWLLRVFGVLSVVCCVVCRLMYVVCCSMYASCVAFALCCLLLVLLND